MKKTSVKRKKPLTLRQFMKRNWGQFILHAIFLFYSVCYVYPMALAIMASFTHQDVFDDPYIGLSLFPAKLTLDGYKAIWLEPSLVVNGYRNTIAFSVLSTVLMLVLCGLFAYPLSRSHFYFRKPINTLLIVMMLFSGGGTASYIVNTQLLHLKGSFWAYIWPYLFTSWNVILMRTNFKSVPGELLESARMDGASELRTCFTIIFPLCKATMAALAFSFLIGRWSDWGTTITYLSTNTELWSLSYAMYRVDQTVKMLTEQYERGEISLAELNNSIPEDSLQFAMALITTGPVMVIFPAFQKYFAKGMIVGSVKG